MNCVVLRYHRLQPRRASISTYDYNPYLNQRSRSVKAGVARVRRIPSASTAWCFSFSLRVTMPPIYHRCGH